MLYVYKKERHHTAERIGSESILHRTDQTHFICKGLVFLTPKTILISVSTDRGRADFGASESFSRKTHNTPCHSTLFGKRIAWDAPASDKK